MKYRIIERGDGKFKVQFRMHWLDKWRDQSVYCTDYPKYDSNDELRNDRWSGVFSSLELAQEKVRNLVDEINKEKLKNKFKVIEEVSV